MHKLTTLFVAAVLLQGCVNLKPKENTTRFYVLGAHAVTEAESSASSVSGYAVGLRKLNLASYLHTPHIVIRLGTNEVSFSEFHRWGEDLSGAINRTVAQLLAKETSIQRADVAPWPVGAHHDYVIQLQVLHFEGVVHGPSQMIVHLETSWQILDSETLAVLRKGVTDVRQDATSADTHAGIVSGLDDALKQLSDDLVAAMGAL